VFVWARLSRTPLQVLGFTALRRWSTTIAGGAIFGIALKLGLKIIVMPLLGAPDTNIPYHYLVGNTKALPAIIAFVVLSGGFAEEVFYRGYLFERFGALLGSSKQALAAAIVFSTALFAAAHYSDQGLAGVQQAVITGLVFGGLFAWRRQLWLVMIVHAAFDLTAIALIYWDLERAAAHLLLP